jgi:diketogulonate reductase-like aldo/keto reductase
MKTMIPAVNQVEFHPHLIQSDLRQYAKEKGIQMEVWSPLGGGQLFNFISFQSRAYNGYKNMQISALTFCVFFVL